VRLTIPAMLEAAATPSMLAPLLSKERRTLGSFEKVWNYGLICFHGPLVGNCKIHGRLQGISGLKLSISWWWLSGESPKRNRLCVT
jgi:hypothetical protein